MTPAAAVGISRWISRWKAVTQRLERLSSRYQPLVCYQQRTQHKQLHNCYSTPNFCTHRPTRLSTQADVISVCGLQLAHANTHVQIALLKSILLSFMAMLVCAWTKG